MNKLLLSLIALFCTLQSLPAQTIGDIGENLADRLMFELEYSIEKLPAEQQPAFLIGFETKLKECYQSSPSEELLDVMFSIGCNFSRNNHRVDAARVYEFVLAQSKVPMTRGKAYYQMAILNP